MTTSTKIGQSFDRSILMDENAACLSKTEAFCHLLTQAKFGSDRSGMKVIFVAFSSGSVVQ